MNIKEEYRTQTDRLCGQAEFLSGKDILEMAKNYIGNESTACTKRRRIRNIRTGLIVAAACVSALGLTAVAAGHAGYGPLSSLFRETFQDETTAELIDSGYLYEIDQSFTDGIYRADLIAVSGDSVTPKLVIDLYIDDPEIAAANDSIKVGVYTLGTEQYDHELDDYTWFAGTAEKDAEVPNLYHASVTGAPLWMTNGEECVIDICAIYRNDLQGEEVIDRTHMETRITIPTSAFQSIASTYYSADENTVLHCGGTDYRLTEIEYSLYNTWVSFVFRSDSEDCDALLRDAVLTVDGTEYHGDPESCCAWRDETGECGEAGLCYITPYFPPIDYDAANIITISDGTTTYVLKDSRGDTQDSEEAEPAENAAQETEFAPEE